MEFVHTVVVNGVEINATVEFNGDEEIYHFPELYKVAKLGKTTFWRIRVEGNEYFRESGFVGGKVKQYAPVQAVAKNVGRSNETTPENQALFEAYSEWKHKKKQLYTEETVEQGGGKTDGGGVLSDRLRPMLAEKFTERKKYVIYPAAVSPKLDGVRAMIYQDEKEIIFISRLGKQYLFMDNLRAEARKFIEEFDQRVVLDGELYSHNIPFNAISGAVRSKNKPSKFDDKLEFHIFDLYLPDSPDLSYEGRMDLLREVCNREDFKYLHFVFYDNVFKEEQISIKHAEYVKMGYEGLMVRNLMSPYRLGRRTNDLLKYKEFEDDEFKVIDVVEGMGTERGAAVFVCVTKDGQKFSVRPRGSIEKRKMQFKNKSKYIGKMLTVRYQPLSKEDVLPRFPVGIKFDPKTELIGVDIRDYE